VVAVRTYTAKAVRSGDWWAVDVPEVPGVHTQAKRLDQAEGMARDALALFFDVPEDSFDVTVEAELPDEARELVDRTKALRSEADRIAAEAKAATTDAVLVLHSTLQLPYRDTAKILDVSFQRTQQIAKDASAKARQPRRVSAGRKQTAWAGQKKAAAGRTARRTRA
jgi:predicted RNase H-like HicB family nuclease